MRSSFTMTGYIEWKKSYLKASKLGKTKCSSAEDIARMESDIAALEKEIVKKEDKTANKKKVKLSEREVLEKRIENIENLLNNEGFLKKVGENVINIKTKELEDLRKKLEELD